jgi:hypothetical protein
VLCLHNVSSVPVATALEADEFGENETWENLLDERSHGLASGRMLSATLEPYEVKWFALKPAGTTVSNPKHHV